MSEIFEKFEIFGIPESTEDAILASILQGDPTLLIGPPGTAKTEILECIALSMREYSKKKNPNDPSKWLNYKLYDTSKLNPEDLMGFPNPNSLMNGQMEFIKLPSSIWDKDFVVWDEINRCEKSRQSNLFEILRNRRLCGTPVATKFMFSSMNPFGDAGTVEMSDALADRHMYFIWFESFSDMTSDNQLKVINRVGNYESNGIKYWTNKKFDFDTSDTTINEKLAACGEQIETIIQKAIPIYDQLKSGIGDKIGKIITRITRAVAEEKSKDSKIGYFEVSGRRASLMYRALLSLRAIQQAKSIVFGNELPNLQGALVNAAVMAMPIGVGQKVSADTITRLRKVVSGTVAENFDIIFGKNLNADKIYQLIYEKHPMKRLHGLLSIDNIPELLNTKLWSELYDDAKDNYLEFFLVSLNTRVPGTVPPHIKLNDNIIRDPQLKTEQKITNPAFLKHKNIINQCITNCDRNPLMINATNGVLSYLHQRNPKADEAEVIRDLTSLNALITTVKDLYEKKINSTSSINDSSKQPN